MIQEEKRCTRNDRKGENDRNASGCERANKREIIKKILFFNPMYEIILL